jgi:hypothetical protein
MIDIEIRLTKIGRASVAKRFSAQFTKGHKDECWEWSGLLGAKEYGRFYFPSVDSHKQVQVQAHRVSYLLFIGTIPEGLTIDHTCRNHRCVNPSHLEAVSNRENVLRGEGPTAVNARRTECRYGHPYTEDNTTRYHGSRYCNECSRRWKREYAARQRMNKNRQ